MADEASEAAAATGSSVNSQILDAVAAVAALGAGNAPAASFALLDVAMTDAAAMAMHNAVARQQADGIVAAAAMAAACARINEVATPPGPAPAAAARTGRG
jgi:killing trait domain-containing protein